MIDQLRSALAGPHGTATIVTWAVAGIAVAITAVHLVRPGPRRRGWNRWAAAGFPLAVAVTLLAGSVAPALRGSALDAAMFLRMSGFWAMVVTAPFAVGRVVDLRPPPWLHRTHLALAGAFLLLLTTSDLALRRNDVFHPPTQFGPMAVALLLPVAASLGWWLLTCLGHARSRTDVVLVALGAATTSLALIAAALVLEPVLADHLLVVGFLPVLAAITLVDLHHRWQARRVRARR